MEVKLEGMKIPKIEYDVYRKLQSNKLEQLDLSVCINQRILLSIPIESKKSENLDKYNSSSGYYNDICYSATTENKTDIILKDRKQEYIDGNTFVCQEDCYFSKYNYTSQKADCDCKVKKSSLSFADININKTELLKNFIDFKSFMNLNILSCHKILLSKKIFFYNIGCYNISFILIFHIISIFIFYIKQLGIIEYNIKDIIFSIKNIKFLKPDKNIKENKTNNKGKNKKSLFNNNYNNNNYKQNKGKKNKFNNIIKNNDKNNNYIININNDDNKILPKNENKLILKKKQKKNKNITNNKNKKNENISSIRSLGKNKSFGNDEGLITSNINKGINRNEESKTNQKIIDKVKNVMKYNDEEMNDFSYELARENDKRTFCIYYVSLLKTKHLLFFSFCYNNDYNSKIIKMDLFFVSFATLYTVNALFFDDDTMHKIYIDKGSFDFIYNLPQIIYTTIISGFMNGLISTLSTTSSNIINLKQSANKNNAMAKKDETIKIIKIKLSLFFIIDLIFLVLFWFYLACFCAVYKNTQMHLIKDTLISFATGMVSPFAIYIIPGLFRISALNAKKKDKEYMYKFSKALQIL